MVVTATLLATVAGCSDDEACASCEDGDGDGAATGSGGSGGGAVCAETTGELRGTVSLFAAPGSPDSLAAPNATLELRREPLDTPIHAMADDQSTYLVELPAGSWIVGGTSEDGYCKTFMPKTAEVEACGTTDLDVVLEACVN
jgi:hypothetical protein